MKSILTRQIYSVWQSMRQRCYNPNNKDYARYGGRGITICDEWKDNFEKFFSDVGQKPEHKSLDRIDNNKPYSKENCKWSSAEEQCANRRDNVFVEFNGKLMTFGQWDRHLKLGKGTTRGRLCVYGWTKEKALKEIV